MHHAAAEGVPPSLLLTVGHKSQRKALESLVPADEVIVNCIDGQPQELILLQTHRVVVSTFENHATVGNQRSSMMVKAAVRVALQGL